MNAYCVTDAAHQSSQSFLISAAVDCDIDEANGESNRTLREAAS